jgi:hypothetical protein
MFPEETLQQLRTRSLAIDVMTAMETFWAPTVRPGMPLPRFPALSAPCVPAVRRTCRSTLDRYDSGSVLSQSLIPSARLRLCLARINQSAG